MRKIRQLLGLQRGQAMLEMALVLPILILLVMGMMEFGRAFNGVMVMTAAAREGARAAAVGATDTLIASTAKEAASGFAATAITVTINPAAATRKRGDAVTVSLSTPIEIITPLIGQFFPGGVFQAKGSAVMRVE